MVRLVYLFLFCMLFPQFSINNVPSKTENVDGIAAIVENSVVLKSDVMQQAFLFSQQQGVDPLNSPAIFENIYLETLDQMVNNLVLYEASLKDTNIVLDQLFVEESLDLEIKKRIEYAGSPKKLEELFGEPLSMIRAKLRLEIKKRLRVESYTASIYRSVNPTIAEVKDFYVSFKDSLPLVPEMVSLSIYEWPVSVDSKKDVDIKNFLKGLKDSVENGKSFYDAASFHSDDSGSAQSGGRLGYVVRGSLFPEYEEVAFSLSPGEVSDPFKTELGYHIVLLEDRVGEKIKTSHILKTLEMDASDIEASKLSFVDFLSEYDVYNSVDRFDSLCTHSSLAGSNYSGVFPKTILSSLPDFIDRGILKRVGFKDVFYNNNNLYLVRVWDYTNEQKATLNNFYPELLNLTKNNLINEKILDLINKEKEKLYVEKFY